MIPMLILEIGLKENKKTRKWQINDTPNFEFKRSDIL